MKVGIVTFHWGDNYGAVLQSYALQEAIFDLGHHVEFVNYNPFTDGKNSTSSLASLFAEGVLQRRIKKIINRVKNRHLQKKFGRQYYQAFDQFRTNFLRIGAEKNLDLTDYDVVVVGSDQVWNGSWIGDAITYYYLEDFTNVKKISYAACIGNDRQPEKYSAQIKELLGNFESISVRNKFSYEYVVNVSGRTPAMVCDPTMLNDFSSLKVDNCNLEGLPEKFILVYALEQSLKKLGGQIVRQLKERLQLPVVSISSVFHNGWTFPYADKILYTVSPVEWLWLVKNAVFVCTDSFHGLVFSLKDKKPALGYRDDGWRSFRLLDLMQHYQIEDRLVARYSEKRVDDILDSSINYDRVSEMISADVDTSLSFLEKALLA